MSPAVGKRAGATRERVECCRPWAGLDAGRRAKWEWQVLHQFGHSRTTFTVATLADRARVEEARADELVKMAQFMKWIWTPAEGIWVGQLAARR